MGTAKPKKPSAKQKRRLMRADAEARKVNGIRLKPIKHKKLYGAAARSCVESRLSSSPALSSHFYEDTHSSTTEEKPKVKPVVMVRPADSAVRPADSAAQQMSRPESSFVAGWRVARRR